MLAKCYTEQKSFVWVRSGKMSNLSGEKMTSEKADEHETGVPPSTGRELQTEEVSIGIYK